jgi:hypothetical protein
MEGQVQGQANKGLRNVCKWGDGDPLRETPLGCVEQEGAAALSKARGDGIRLTGRGM